MLSHCRRYFVPNSLRLSCKDKNLVEINVHTRYTFNHYNMAIGSTITVEQPGFQLQYDRFSRRHTSRYPNRIVTIRSYHYAYSAVWIFCLPIPICDDDDCKLWNFRWSLVDLNYEMEKVVVYRMSCCRSWCANPIRIFVVPFRCSRNIWEYPKNVRNKCQEISSNPGSNICPLRGAFSRSMFFLNSRNFFEILVENLLWTLLLENWPSLTNLPNSLSPLHCFAAKVPSLSHCGNCCTWCTSSKW